MYAEVSTVKFQYSLASSTVLRKPSIFPFGRIHVAGHDLLTSPITLKEGWLQERGLFFSLNPSDTQT